MKRKRNNRPLEARCFMKGIFFSSAAIVGEKWRGLPPAAQKIWAVRGEVIMLGFVWSMVPITVQSWGDGVGDRWS